MTSKPLTATGRSRAPRVAVGGGLLAAAVLLSGCHARVGAAATIGSDQISTKTLDSDYLAASKTSAGQPGGDTLRKTILTQLIQHEQYTLVARKLGVTSSQGAIDAAYQAAVSQSGAAQAQGDYYYRIQSEDLSNVVGVMAYLSKKTGTVDSVDLYAVPVKDAATGATVVAALKAHPESAAAIAKQYSSNQQLGALGGQAGPQSVTNLQAPALATLPLNQPSLQTIQSSPVVVKVLARLDSGDLASAIAALPKVKVNPRFGAWGTDPKTNSNGVISLASDIVSPGAQPAASAVPAASGAPQPSAAPQDGSAPQATAAPAPTGVPATVAPAPSASSPLPSAAPSS